VLECVVNVSEGRRRGVIDAVAATAGRALLDVHTDADHNRTVLTLVGEDAAREVARAAVGEIDLREHEGVHPRIGAVDVVPFVPLDRSTMADAIAARDRFCTWAAAELALPCFRYGPERSLPEVRRGAFSDLAPDCGPAAPHPSAGACAVGARPILVAYNVWLTEPNVALAKRIATSVRGPAVRALGLDVGGRAQVSMNLVDPTEMGPADIVDRIGREARIDGCELVGLVPRVVLDAIPPARWATLGLSAERTIEARLASAGWR
jgi:glutamate formiminotransferase / 5-formyltetrahydrofolate cyclo-ligase